MKRVRNDPCICGSGKKYKKCHGRNRSAASPLPPPPDQDRTKAELPIAGMSGHVQSIISVPQFADPRDPRNQGGPQGLPGAYGVTFTFSRPGFSTLVEYQCADATHVESDSHLAIAKPALNNPTNPDADQIRIYATTDDGRLVFTGYPNRKGFLSRIETTIQATDFIDARRRAYKALAPAISNWAAHFDIPMSVYQCDIREERTGAVRFTFLTPFRAMPLNVQAKGPLTKEFRG